MKFNVCENALILSAGLLDALLTTEVTIAQTSGGDGNMAGRTSKTEFDQMNEEGAAIVAAITPNSAKLLKPDATLMMQVAMGGMMQ